eukprot:GHRR01004481.1.p1 GENE.GHRR01004481.1~~GHRR01004481.1.p1  ORF type:complete len:347 (+),score=117.46 GHRR01004481.1:307-1347(+)
MAASHSCFSPLVGRAPVNRFRQRSYMPTVAASSHLHNSSTSTSNEHGLVLQRIKQQFEGRAAGYDNDNTYHPPLAQRLINMCDLKPGGWLLDLATGTGLVALKAAAIVGPTGKVVGVDLSEAMLQQGHNKYTAALQDMQQQSTQQQQLADVQFMVGNMEHLAQYLPAEWANTFDAITCSAAVPFLWDPHKALADWRGWLKQPGGVLAFNAFVPPALEDFGMYVKLAADFGFTNVVDPCAALGSVELLQSALKTAGYKSIEVTPEAKERWYNAPSIDAYAEQMWGVSLNNNPFIDPCDLQRQPDKLQTLHDAYITAVTEDITTNDRYDKEGQRVLSRYTMLHVLAKA